MGEISERDDPEVILALGSQLQNPDMAVVAQAAVSLSEMEYDGKEDLMPLLFNALQDPSIFQDSLRRDIGRTLHVLVTADE